MKVLFIALVASYVFWACSGNKKNEEQAFLETLDSAAANAPVIDEQVISSILEQIPSPLETSVLLKQSGSRYNEDLLNTPGNVSKYNANFDRALNLGIYGTD